MEAKSNFSFTYFDTIIRFIPGVFALLTAIMVFPNAFHSSLFGFITTKPVGFALGVILAYIIGIVIQCISTSVYFMKVLNWRCEPDKLFLESLMKEKKIKICLFQHHSLKLSKEEAFRYSSEIAKYFGIKPPIETIEEYDKLELVIKLSWTLVHLKDLGFAQREQTFYLMARSLFVVYFVFFILIFLLFIIQVLSWFGLDITLIEDLSYDLNITSFIIITFLMIIFACRAKLQYLLAKMDSFKTAGMYALLENKNT